MNDNLIAEGPNHAAALALLNDLMLVLNNASRLMARNPACTSKAQAMAIVVEAMAIETRESGSE